MRVFAIRDEEDCTAKDLAYLIYYEKDKQFFIELPEDADPWETPLLLSSFIKKGERTINSYWSKLWVTQRIVPTDRQNISQVLKENHLSEYDEFNLLMLANGRCAQDSYYLTEIDKDFPSEHFIERYEKKVNDVIPLDNNGLLVFFRNGEVKRYDVELMKKDDRLFSRILAYHNVFQKVSMQSGGYGVCWGESVAISDKEIYDNGIDIPLSMNDFLSFLSERVISTAEAAKLLHCSRQNINDLVTRGKLHPVKTEQKNTFFLRSEILQRLW